MRKVLLHHGVRFYRDLAGYTAGGLTQPTVTIGLRIREKCLGKASPAYAEKIHANKVGWDKQSVPNMLCKRTLRSSAKAAGISHGVHLLILEIF